jgi:hypothetical protein
MRSIQSPTASLAAIFVGQVRRCGWKLFEPHLVHGLGLQDLSADQLNDLVRESVLKVIES